MSYNEFIPSNLIMIEYKTFSKSIFIEIYIGKMFSGNLNCLQLIIIFQKHTFIINIGHRYVETSVIKHF